MKYIYLLILACSWVNLYSQCSIDEIDFDQIYYKSVKKFIINQKNLNVNDIADIHASCSSNSDLSTFEKQEKKYLIKENFAKVWNNYLKTNPAESWEGKLVSFGLLIEKKNNNIIYPGDDFQCIDTGQVIFLNLRLLKGFYNLPMGFEVIKVDEDEGLVEFSYIEGNASQGMQRLKFAPTSKGYTEITHSSYYKSKSKIRDKALYPFFHLKTTNEFHRKFKRKLRRS